MSIKEIKRESHPSARPSSMVQKTGDRRESAKPLDQRPLNSHSDRSHNDHSNGDHSHGDQSHGNHSQGEHSRNDSKHEIQPRRPLPKSVIPDEDADETAAVAALAEAAKSKEKRSRFRHLLVIALLVVAAFGASTIEALRYWSNTAEALLTAKISAALAVHTALHSQDGKGYDEVTLVDWIRHCLGSTLSSDAAVIVKELAEPSGPAIVAAAERRCLRDKLVDLATRQVVAEETARQAGDDPSAVDRTRKISEELHFVIAFARSRAYALPEEFQVFKSDSAILKEYDSTKDPDPVTKQW